MSLILCYCEKCGQHYDISDKRLNDLKNVTCTGCCSVGYFKLVPQKYLNEGMWGINKNLEGEFIEKFIKASPNFDQASWDRRVGYQETRKHYDEILRNEMQEEKNVPKCPTCQSTNLKKITVTSKAMNTALFGLFGTKRHKTFHCNNCGYEW